MLQIKDLNFSYKKHKILKDINMLVKPGQILALVGPNGSGKSTLLRCLNGFLQPDSGRVTKNANGYPVVLLYCRKIWKLCSRLRLLSWLLWAEARISSLAGF